MQEEQKIYGGIPYKTSQFRVAEAGKAEQVFDAWLAYCKSIEEHIVNRFGPFQSRRERPEARIRDYGRNRLVLQCGYDETVRWKGGFVIQAETENGPQAVSLLEYWLNYERPEIPVTEIRPEFAVERGALLGGYQPIDRINFIIGESRTSNGARCAHFYTEANWPHLFWREIYNGYVEELGEKAGNEPGVRKP